MHGSDPMRSMKRASSAVGGRPFIPRDFIGFGSFGGFDYRFRGNEAFAWTAATRSRPAPADGVVLPARENPTWRIGVLRCRGLPYLSGDRLSMLRFLFHKETRYEGG